jgi:uncharacterized protein
MTDRSNLLGRDYFVVFSRPVEGVGPDRIEAHRDAHIAWLLVLEAAGVLFISGPLLSGPDVRAGYGITVLRAENEEAAAAIAAEDPFRTAGLRRSDVYRWRVNEGSIGIRLSLGTGGLEWA